MEEKHIDVLMKEYDLVSQHWMSATKQKAVVIQITGSAIVALLGVGFLKQLSWIYFSLIAPVLIIVAAFIYAQKEGDFWVDVICLESIEKIINMAEGKELLAYTHKFRNILYRKEKIVSFSPITFMNVLRMVPAISFIAGCYYMIYNEYGLCWLSVYVFMFCLSLFYTIYSRFYVIKKAQQILNERLGSITTSLTLTANNSA